MTAKQFYSEDGQKLQSLQYQHDKMLNRQGYYSKGVAKLGERIRKLTEKMNKEQEVKVSDTTKAK